MPIALVQDISSSENDSTTITTTFAAPPTDGNLLVLILAHRLGSGLALNISGSPWTFVDVIQYSGTRNLEMYYKLASSTAAAVTVTFENKHRAILGLAEYSGMASSNVFDDWGSILTDTDTNTSLTVPLTAASSQAEELLICAIAKFGGTTSPTWTDAFVAQDNRRTGDGSTHLSYQWADRIVAAIGTYETTGGWTTGRAAAGIIASFRGPFNQAIRSGAVITT